MTRSQLALATLPALMLAFPVFPQVQLTHTDQAFTIDGNLDEPQWAKATPIELIVETSPNENTPAPVKTFAYAMTDGDTLYFAFDARDPDASAIRANLTDRDNAWGDDMIGIKLDPSGQGRLAYQFFVNPYGVQEDSIENELTGDESDAWDGIWQTGAKITERGFQVEVALPLRILNFDDTDPNPTWGIELVRFYPRSETHRLSIAPLDRNLACTLCQMVPLTGLKDLKASQQLQITPTLTARQDEKRRNDKSPWNTEDEVDVGMDIRWGITPDTLLNATINPDFSQVEADSGQLDVNTTFALFFPEKRPFYLDNADLFDTYESLIHTRNLAEPKYGVKLSGSRQKHSFGILQTKDEQTNFLMPGNLGSSLASLGDDSQNFAGRYRYNYSDDLTIGMLATARTSGDYHNYTLATDGRIDFSAQDYLTFVLIGSDTQYPDDLAASLSGEARLRAESKDDLSGISYEVGLNHEERDWNAFASYRHADDDFRADLGFIDTVDSAKAIIGGGYNWYPTGHFFNKLRVSGDVDRTENNAGELIEQETEIYFSGNGKWQSYFHLYVGDRERRGRRENADSLAIDGNAPLFDETYGGLTLEFTPIGNLDVDVDLDIGDEIDFANNQLGESLEINPAINWRPVSQLKLKLEHLWKQLDVDGGTLFTANLTDLRLSWQFDVYSFLRLTAIYTDIERDLSLYTRPGYDADEQSLEAELLYGYKLNPQTVFYLGYADGRFDDDNLDSLTQTNRSVFAKFSYAWLL